MILSKKGRPLFSFSGCSWGMIYQLGVARAIQEIFNSDLNRYKFAGSSSGCFAALMLAAKIDWSEGLSLYKQMASKARNYFLGPIGKMSRYQRLALEELTAKDKELYLKVNNKLFVSVTLLPSFKNRLYRKFLNNDDMIDKLMGSFYIPIYSREVIILEKNVALDGGFSNNSPFHQSKGVISVSPNSLHTSIHPQKPLAWTSNYKPASEIELERVFKEGQKDAIKFLDKNNKYF